MKRFELVFRTHFIGHGQNVIPEQVYSRVIVVQDLAFAQEIAKAMLGEEVYALEHLENIVSVVPTEKDPDIASWDPELTWERIIKRLEMPPEIDFVNFNGKKVGIFGELPTFSKAA